MLLGQLNTLSHTGKSFLFQKYVYYYPIIIQQILLNIGFVAHKVGTAATLGCHSENYNNEYNLTFRIVHYKMNIKHLVLLILNLMCPIPLFRL